MIRRRLLACLSVASLILFVAIVALWVRGYSTGDCLSWDHQAQGVNYELYSAGGQLAVETSDDTFFGDPSERRSFDPRKDAEWLDVANAFRRHAYRAHHFGIASYVTFSEGSAGIHYCIVVVPCWFTAALFAFWPCYSASLRSSEHRRMRAGLCPACGYDLRASPDRCPECGAVTAQKSRTTA